MSKAYMALLIGLLAGPVCAEEVEDALLRLRGELGASADVAIVEAAYRDATNRLAAATLDAAMARTRMASHTGAILRRELKKVSASARLVEMTRKTGRREEIQRYETRHDTLLQAIETIATEYRMMIEDLCEMPGEHVVRGFAAYEKMLVEREVADAIKVNNQVKAHYGACCAGGAASKDQWKKELKEL